MIFEIRVTSKSKTDPKGLDLKAEIARTLGIKSIKNIKTAKVYRLEGIPQKKAEEFTKKVLFESIDHDMSFDKPIFKTTDHLIEIAYKPGVMNPEVGSILKSARDLGINLKAADSSWEYAISGKLSKAELEKIIDNLLVNKNIEQVVKKSPKTLTISGQSGTTKTIPIRRLTNTQLMDLSKDRLFLNLEEMKAIQSYYKKIKKEPKDCEVEVLAQTWSEHCVHKTFKADLTIDGKGKKPLFERIKSTAKNNSKLIVSAFDDNSGIIDFYDGYGICGKVETHNSPSAIEPYGGAMTGSGGVFRDILGTGQGARVIASTDIFCFAPYDMPKSLLPPGCLPPDYLFRRVIAGVGDYGNRVGIPTNNGSVHFHADFRAKPTVAVGAYGLIQKSKAKKLPLKVGDLILTLGGRTGRDGIHGATFSSGEMTSRTINVSGSAVQIGNAIEEKRVIDAIVVMTSLGIVKSITDCGAGGYSSAVGEMAERIGATVELEKVPLKYSGLAPWEIFLSESQERMVIAISPQNLKKVMAISKKYNVETNVFGKFDGSKRLKVVYGNQRVCDLDMEFLHNGIPKRHMIGKSSKKQIKEDLPKNQNLEKTFLAILAHGNVCSKEPIVRLYDHNVQGSSALHPFGGVDFDAPNDGAVVKPILSKPFGLAITHGLNPALNKIDSYWGSVWAIAEACANFVAIGGDLKNAALIDNFIWPFPDEESLADLDKSVDACVDTANILDMPFVSGKDSLSSTYRFPDGKVLKIPPVLLISIFGRIPDVTKTVSSDFKKANSTLVLVGSPDLGSMGGSTYFDISNASSAQIPKVDLKNLPKVLESITNGIKSGEIFACHDISEGGIATAIAEMAFGAGWGADVDVALISKNIRPDFVLFNETSGTFVVEVQDKATAKNLFKNIPHTIIGKTSARKTVRINQGNKSLLNTSLSTLKESWQEPMREIFH